MLFQVKLKSLFRNYNKEMIEIERILINTQLSKLIDQEKILWTLTSDKSQFQDNKKGIKF